MSHPEKYECTLDKASLKKAQDELGENPKEREAAVQTLRKWVEDNSAWLKSPTDTVFLLCILRTAKFAQLAARKKLVKLWTTRTKYKQWFENIDTKDEKIVASLKTGNILILPERDNQGRAVWIIKPGAMDVSGKIHFDDMMRAGMAICDHALLMDENKVVNGSVMIYDCTNMTVKHQTYFGLENTKNSMDAWINGFAARYKGVHYYNSNPVFDAIFVIVQPLMPAKLRKRLHFHGKHLSTVYEHIPHCYLPDDYRPDDATGKKMGSFQQCVDKQIEALQQPEVRDFILKFSSSGYGIKEELKPKDEELFSESFRKLNID